MAMIFDAFAGRCSELLGQLIQEEVVMILGVKDDLRRLQEKLKKIKNVLSDAERRRIQDATTNGWLSELKDVMYDADDIIDLCRIKGRQLLQGEGESRPPTSSSPGCSRFPFLSCFTTTVTSIPLRHEIGKQIQKLSQRLEEIYKHRQMFSLPQGSGHNVVATHEKPRQTYALPKSNVVGRQTKSNEKKIAESLVKSEDKSLLVFAITWLGGIGKTTLAQKIYNNQKVEAHFGRKRIWVCVSQNYSETELVKQIIRSAGGDYGRAEANAELQPILTSTLAGSRFLLVLDDLWRADLWTDLLQAPLEHAGTSGSRVLITTRNVDVAKTMQATQSQIHEVEKLNANEGWELLCKSVFKDVINEDIQNLHEIGMQIVEKCDGLPLAIEAVAGVLIKKGTSKREWENAYKSHAWAVEGRLPKTVRGALYFSYEDLPSHLKQCFLLCSLFPEDALLFREKLILHWVAEGFAPAQGDSQLEDVAEDCYNDFISRCLLRLDPEYMDGSVCHHWSRISQLRILKIDGAAAVVTIGPEFLGVDRKDGHGHHGTPTAFPKLEELFIFSMPNLEEWLLIIAEEVEGGRGTTIPLLPRLQELHIRDCPKLKALPQGLKNATALKILAIKGADSLREIKSIPSLEEQLAIWECQRLERISHLPALRTMYIRDSSRTLKFVENLDTLQTLTLRLEDDWTERLPEWLLGLVQQAKVNGELEALFLYCTEALAKRCIMGGEYWPLLNHIPDVSVSHNN